MRTMNLSSNSLEESSLTTTYSIYRTYYFQNFLKHTKYNLKGVVKPALSLWDICTQKARYFSGEGDLSRYRAKAKAPNNVLEPRVLLSHSEENRGGWQEKWKNNKKKRGKKNQGRRILIQSNHTPRPARRRHLTTTHAQPSPSPHLTSPSTIISWSILIYASFANSLRILFSFFHQLSQFTSVDCRMATLSSCSRLSTGGGAVQRRPRRPASAATITCHRSSSSSSSARVVRTGAAAAPAAATAPAVPQTNEWVTHKVSSPL